MKIKYKKTVRVLLSALLQRTLFLGFINLGQTFARTAQVHTRYGWLKSSIHLLLPRSITDEVHNLSFLI